jgi:hypothetical protein
MTRFLVPTLRSVIQEEHVAESSPLVGSSKNMTGGLLTSSGRRTDYFTRALCDCVRDSPTKKLARILESGEEQDPTN